MAKKKTQPRRAPRAADPRMYGDGKPSQAAQQTDTAGRTTNPAAVQPTNGHGRTNVTLPRSVPVTVTQNYDYVKKDLRRLGIVAASIFGILVVLGLIVR
jgi:hypothetical protein